MNHKSGSYQTPDLPAPRSWAYQHSKPWEINVVVYKPPSLWNFVVVVWTDWDNELQEWLLLGLLCFGVVCYTVLSHWHTIYPREQAPPFGCLCLMLTCTLSHLEGVDWLCCLVPRPHFCEVFRKQTTWEPMKLWPRFFLFRWNLFLWGVGILEDLGVLLIVCWPLLYTMPLSLGNIIHTDFFTLTCGPSSSLFPHDHSTCPSLLLFWVREEKLSALNPRGRDA